MASFQPKIGLQWPRNRENKNCLSVPFQLNEYQQIPKKEKKESKNKKIPL